MIEEQMTAAPASDAAPAPAGEAAAAPRRRRTVRAKSETASEQAEASAAPSDEAAAPAPRNPTSSCTENTKYTSSRTSFPFSFSAILHSTAQPMRSSKAGPASRLFSSSTGFAAKVTISPGAKSFAAVSAVNPVSISRFPFSPLSRYALSSLRGFPGRGTGIR